MTIDTDFDVNDAYNRIADVWYPIFAAKNQMSMPIAACAYPINMGEYTIAAIRDDVLPEDYHLRWQMAIGADRAEYHLHCNWQGRAWQHDDQRYLFIENAVGWVDFNGDDVAEQLDVQVAFGRPSFENYTASMVADFLVSETDVDGVVEREVHRPFQIYGDGRRDALF